MVAQQIFLLSVKGRLDRLDCRLDKCICIYTGFRYVRMISSCDLIATVFHIRLYLIKDNGYGLWVPMSFFDIEMYKLIAIQYNDPVLCTFKDLASYLINNPKGR